MRVEIHEYELRLRHRWEIAVGATEAKRNAYVTVEEEGTVGEGEAAFHRGFGESPESVWSDLQRAADILRTSDEADLGQLDLQGAARAAVEVALLDCKSRREGLSLGEYLGVPRPAGPVVTSYSIGIDAPGKMAEKTAEASQFEVLKVKLGSREDRERFEAVRSATDVPIRVDANGGWESREEAAAMMEWLADDRGVEFVEQPLPRGRLEDTAWLRERSALPIILDEDVRVAADVSGVAGVCDGVNIKLMKAGGLGEALCTIDAARVHGLEVMLGCMIESSLGIVAALHLASRADWIDLDGHLLLANDPYEGIGLRGGRLVLPEGPGTGVHRNES